MKKMGFKNIIPNNDYLTHPEDASMGSVWQINIYIFKTHMEISQNIV